MSKNNFPIYLSLATIFGVLIGVFMNGNSSGFSLNSNSKNEAKIRRLMDYIDQNYVDTVNTSTLLDNAISDMRASLILTLLIFQKKTYKIFKRGCKESLLALEYSLELLMTP